MESSETLRDGDVSVPDIDPAPDTPPTSLSKTLQPSRKTSVARAKRPTRERQKKERFNLLHSMTADERREFLKDEETAKEEVLQKLKRAVAADTTNQRIAVDLGFDSIMNDKELRSLANQLRLSYGAVKQMREPFQLLFCNPSEQLETSLGRFGAPHWYVQWRHGSDTLVGHFSPSDLVYLSPDSPNVLEKMDPTKIYVIGGIVDKSRKKEATLNAATEAGITTVRLPIQENFPERLDHILNVNTVIDVLINFQELDDWPRALDIAIPQRKRSQVGRKALRRRKKQQQQQMIQNSAKVPALESIDTDTTSKAIDAYAGPDELDKLEGAASPLEETSPTEDLGLWIEDLTV